MYKIVQKDVDTIRKLNLMSVSLKKLPKTNLLAILVLIQNPST